METRSLRLLLWFLALLPVSILAQGGDGEGTTPPPYRVSGVITVPPWDGKPLGILWCRPPAWHGTKGALGKAGLGNGPVFMTDPDYQGEGMGSGKVSSAYQVAVFRSFVANNLNVFSPGDNSMAISDSGYIVSGDNYTIEYYNDNPDTILQYQLHDVFYADSAIRDVPFDPRIV